MKGDIRCFEARCDGTTLDLTIRIWRPATQENGKSLPRRSDDVLNRVLHQWRRRGYSVLAVKTGELKPNDAPNPWLWSVIDMAYEAGGLAIKNADLAVLGKRADELVLSEFQSAADMTDWEWNAYVAFDLVHGPLA